MARRPLLTDEERQALLGIPPNADSLARLFTLSRADQDLVAERRSGANRLGCAVQLALLRHPGTALAYLDQPSDTLVIWMASQIDIPVAAFDQYARRPQTMTDHARQLAATLRLRPPTMVDLPAMIEAAAEAARGTDRGQPIAAAVIAALRAARIILPGAAVIERIAIAGRARARKQAADALAGGLSAEQMAKLDGLLVVDPSVGLTPFAWLKAMPVAPKVDHIRELLNRLHLVRGVGVPTEAAGHVHEDRLQQFVREGRASDAHQLGRYAEHRRRAILVATVLDLKTRLTDAVVERCQVGAPERAWELLGMTITSNPYRGFRYPREVIQHAVWLYHCFSLSLRDVELSWPPAAWWSATRASVSGGCASAGCSPIR